MDHQESKKDTSTDIVETVQTSQNHFAVRTNAHNDPDDLDSRHRALPLRLRYIFLLHLGLWVVLTGWWIAGLVLHRNDKNWLIPFLLWLCCTLWFTFSYLPFSAIWKHVRWLWQNTIVRAVTLLPTYTRSPLAAGLASAGIISTVFALDERESDTRGDRALSLLGYAILLFGLWATSRNKRRIQWRRVIVGVVVQFIIALFVLRTSTGYDIFDFISTLARDLLGFAQDGVAFLTNPDVAKLTWFLIGVVPPIIFFVSLVEILYHYGFLQWFLGKFAMFFSWSMGVSGAEAVAAAAAPFVGQTEMAVLISPYLAQLTDAEIHQILCSGFGTIAGSVLGAYIGLGVNPRALISSCVMSIPASLALSHLRYPEDEEPLTSDKATAPLSRPHETVNGLHALADGAWLGIKIAGMVIAILLCIVALLALVNGVLTWWGHYLNLEGEYDLTIELIVGYICYPIAFLLGVPRNHELLLVGRLIGLKVVTNEFVAYSTFVTQPEYIAISSRSRLIATYSLCGFGNIAAVGSQIGVISRIAPSRAKDVSRLATSALLTGILSTLSSAAVAGMLVIDSKNFTV